MENKAMDRLRQLEKEMYAYRYALSLMEVDEQTIAPTEGHEGRGVAMDVLTAAQYQLVAGDELGRLLAEAANGPLDTQQAAEVRELKHEYEQFVKIPAAEYAAGKRLFSDSGSAWHKAKAASDFAAFGPWLEKVVATKRRWAGYFAPEAEPYAVWLDQFQPGLTVAQTDAFFAQVKECVVPLLARVCKAKAPRTDFLHQSWPVEKQKELSDYVMQVMGLPREHCVLGETEHPFTQNLYDGDVRITTHYHEDDMVSNLYTVIHEGGHALYERNLSPALRYTVLAEGCCTGIHESQSRLFENYVGRSRGFIHFLWPKLTELFPAQLAGVTAEDFYRAVNVAQPSLIRTEADELTYPLHVLIRYELERKLLNGSLPVADLPAEWNRLYKEYLGVDVPDDAHGVLQDVHWSSGDLGYFPGYALGTAYAAQMVRRMRKAFDFDACCASGDLTPICRYQTEHIWQYGKLYQPDALLEMNCGKFDPSVFTKYLSEKYAEIYQL